MFLPSGNIVSELVFWYHLIVELLNEINAGLLNTLTRGTKTVCKADIGTCNEPLTT